MDDEHLVLVEPTLLPGVKHFRASLMERKELIANERAKEVLGWRQRYHLL